MWAYELANSQLSNSTRSPLPTKQVATFSQGRRRNHHWIMKTHPWTIVQGWTCMCTLNSETTMMQTYCTECNSHLHIFAIQKSGYNHDRHDTWQSWFGIATFSPFSSIVLHHSCVRLGWLASEVDVSPSNSWQGCNVPRVIDVGNMVTTQSFSTPCLISREEHPRFFQRCSISENEPSQEGQTFVKETSKLLFVTCLWDSPCCVFRNGHFCNFAGCRKAF